MDVKCGDRRYRNGVELVAQYSFLDIDNGVKTVFARRENESHLLNSEYVPLKEWNTLSTVKNFVPMIDVYSEPHRFYHTAGHVVSVLANVYSISLTHLPPKKDVLPLLVAALYHDAVYDTHRDDNEERSVELMESQLNPETTKFVLGEARRLILLTKNHDPGPYDIPGQILCDADLAVLGAEEDEYLRYAENIRKEYSWVPEPDYIDARMEFLERMLDRDNIFHFSEDDRAINNMQEEWSRLKWTKENI